MIKHTRGGVEIHLNDPYGNGTVRDGVFAGQNVLILGGRPVRAGAPVRVVHQAPQIPFVFDPTYAPDKQPPLDPEGAAAMAEAKKIPDVIDLPEVEMETFTKSTPTEANPFADMQIATFDEDESVAMLPEVTESPAVPGAVTESTQKTSSDPEELIKILQERDLRRFGISDSEFNALCLKKAQVRKIYEQVIGRSSNQPTVNQAVQAILKKARSNAADYTRVVNSIASAMVSA